MLLKTFTEEQSETMLMTQKRCIISRCTWAILHHYSSTCDEPKHDRAEKVSNLGTRTYLRGMNRSEYK